MRVQRSIPAVKQMYTLKKEAMQNTTVNKKTWQIWGGRGTNYCKQLTIRKIMEQIATLFWEQDRESSSMKKEKVFLKENIVISFSRGVFVLL